MGKKSKGKKARFKAAAAAGGKATETKRTLAKKQVVMEAGGGGGGKSTYIGLGIALAVIALVAFVIFGGGSSPFAVVTAEAGAVRIPVSEVNDGHAHFYTYKGRGRGRDINFFVLRSSDGVIRAAFDACDVCFREKRGYRQEGDLMVCNNCGQVFPSVKINVLRGGCNPAPLERSIQSEYLVMNASDIEQGGYYF